MSTPRRLKWHTPELFENSASTLISSNRVNLDGAWRNALTLWNLPFFLDDWIWVRREAGPRGDFVKKQEIEKHEATWRRLVAAVRVVDPDPWRDELRKEVGEINSTVARRLAEDEGALSTRPSR